MIYPESGSWWLHLKSKHKYYIVCCAIKEDDLSDRVIYRRVDYQNDHRIWDRSLEQFMDGRFEKIEQKFK